MEEYTFQNGTFGFKPAGDTAICLGLFDGLHLGHIKLIKEALKSGKKVGVVTFDGEMKQLTNGRDKGLLTMVKDRKSLLEDLGVSYLFVIPFTAEVLNTEAEKFISDFLSPLGAKEVFIGQDFRFGKEARGDYKMLKEYFDVHLVSFQKDAEGKKISTGSIIKLLREGQIEKANADLGRHYRISGKIVHGLGNGGRILGFPTANLGLEDDYVIPKKGVYATLFLLKGQKYLSMTDIGVHPTIDGLKQLSIETNIFGLDEDIYSDEASIEFLGYVREEKKFPTVGELILQLTKDHNFIADNYKI